MSINIDNDYLDVAPLTPSPFGDYTGNGWSDVLSRNTTTNALEIHPGNGGARRPEHPHDQHRLGRRTARWSGSAT